MEPFRIIIDNFVYHNKERELNTDYKMDIVNILNSKSKYNGKQYTLKDIIKLYTKNVFLYLEQEKEYIGFYINEE